MNDNIYYEIANKMLISLEESYYVIVKIFSTDYAFELSVEKIAPIDVVLSRIKDIILDKEIFNKKVNISVYKDALSLTTRIFVEVKDA